MMTVGIIGYGNMGSALARGLRAGNIAFVVSEKKGERTDALRRETGLAALGSAELVSRADLVVLAVKPQELDGLLAEIAPAPKGKRFVSIIAGRPLAMFQSALGTDDVCRFMPNLAAMAGKAAVAVSFPDLACDDFRADCLTVARAMGEPFVIPEKEMSAFTGLSGSGIAYVFSFLHALALGGTAAGIRYDESLKIALATVEGAAAVVRTSGVHPVELLSRVVSPAGTTIQGIRRLETAGFAGAVLEAVEDAARRAQELEK
jgi:pyrroline-5-carboxylate reductase